MKLSRTHILNCFVLEPSIFKDERGYFLESYNQSVFEKTTGITPNFLQDNESKSAYGVIRGLHAQQDPYGQSKLVRVIRGMVLDVVVDARQNSPSFGRIVSVVLDGTTKNQLYVPKGCLHGFSVLEDDTIFSYKCDGFYNREAEIGVNPLDFNLNIDWQIKKGFEVISEKDRKAQDWFQFLNNLKKFKYF